MKITDETPPFHCPGSPLREVARVDRTCAGLETLTLGRNLFRGSRLISWEGDLPLLEDGVYMFSWTRLGSFKNALPSLRDGQMMFYWCRSLVNARGMFAHCRLDADSVYHIADCINFPQERGEIGIGIAPDIDLADLAPALEELDAKNWNVILSR